MVQNKDVAKLAGVGTSTVSRVINQSGYVSEEKRTKILRAIKELNYVPNQNGRNLKQKSSKLVALFVPTIMHPFFSKIAYYIEDYLYQKDFKTIIVSSQGNQDKEVKLLNMIKNGQVDGIIFITNHIHKDIDIKELNVVTLDREMEGIPCIASSNYDSTYEAVTHLVHKGCKNIGYIGGLVKVDSEVKRRYEAYIDVMKKYNLEPIECRVDLLHGEEYQVATKFINDHPELDAIFAQSDTFANCCYQIVLQKNKKVPEDVKIIAFDGVMDEILQHPKFTVVKQNIDKLAFEIVEKLMDRMNGIPCKKLTIVPADLILGETTEVK